jgi:uncharacterized membrane-anchored protein YhcB (DUF1043 family)
MTAEILIGFVIGLAVGAVILGVAVLAARMREAGDDWDSY